MNMKLTVRWVIFALILLLVAITLLLAIITPNSSFWLTILAIFLAALGVVGTFSQWLFPVLAGGSKQSLVSDTAKQSAAVGSIIIDPYQRQKLEEQKTQAVEQEKREKRKKRNRFIISRGSPALLVVSVAVFTFSQLSPQVHLFVSDNDYGSRVTSIAWSPDGTLVASTTQDGRVRIWNVVKGVTSLIYPGVQNQNMHNFVT